MFDVTGELWVCLTCMQGITYGAGSGLAEHELGKVKAGIEGVGGFISADFEHGNGFREKGGTCECCGDEGEGLRFKFLTMEFNELGNELTRRSL